VAQASTVVFAEGHEVTVTTGAGGALTGIKISSAGMRLGGVALAAVIRDTVTRAEAESQHSLADQLGAVTGGRGYLGAVTGTLPDAPAAVQHADPDPDTALAGPPPSPGLAEHIEERLAALFEQVREQARGYTQAHEELADTRITTPSADGTIEVTVAANGTVTGIRIDDAALRHGASVLGDRVCRMIYEARSRAATATAARLQQMPGMRLNLTELVGQREDNRR
jgi:DNA-binding protein YbaB